jgi:hypothetical protein
VQDFVEYMMHGGIGMHAYATASVVAFAQGWPRPAGVFVGTPTNCGSGRICVDSGHELAAGQPSGNIVHWVVDETKLGRPNAIINASA